jgi:hypothetical protein
MPGQLITDNFAIMLVIFDDKDADGIRLALLRVACQAGGGKTLQLLIFTQRWHRQQLSEVEPNAEPAVVNELRHRWLSQSLPRYFSFLKRSGIR